MSHWFILGREPLLSAAEIQAVFPDYGIRYEPPILKLATENLPEGLISRLGGTVKLARELSSSCPKNKLNETLLTYLREQPGKIIFGLSWYVSGKYPSKTVSELETIGKQLKKTLQEEGRSVRYIPNREPILSSVTVDKNGLTRRGAEIIVHDNGTATVALARTIAVQPFEAFSERDFGRPGRDDKSGMLPPKLALMMINLAKVKPSQTLLDPFCGSGTILTEALLAGYTHLIGSDASEKAIEDTTKNHAWVAGRMRPSGPVSFEAFVHDARTLTEKIAPGSIDAIVTEPYLGKPLTGREKKADIETQLKQLAPLYAAAVATFARLLKPHGTVVMIVPRYRIGATWTTLPFHEAAAASGLRVDRLTANEPFLLYARSTQHVGRELWRLVKD